ncbi:MAG: NAD-dependent succinate-semialdehyde dehydrogenase [Patescibacteria group bacterium]
MPIQSINPATGEIIETFTPETWEQVDTKLTNARKTFESWKNITFKERAKLFKNLIEVLDKNESHYAELNTLEMGKPLSQSKSEVQKCTKGCKFYAENAERILAPQYIETELTHSYLRHDPLGIVLAVMPWNFPFWQAMRAAAPVIMAGNVMVLKHSSNVTKCALAIEDMFREAGFPDGVFTTIVVSGADMKRVIQDDRIEAVTVTGSEEAGRRIAAMAGEELKKTVLELGGSDPFIVLDDVDMDKAVENAVLARVRNTGQSCTAAKRFIVVEKRAEAFVEQLVAGINKLKVGDPMDEETDIGPIAREDLREQLDHQVRRSVEMGAELLLGGKIIDRPGYYYEPTILTNVKKGMPVYDDETFGPVATVIVVKDEDEAVEVANDTHLGLGASIWTEDLTRAQELAGRIEAGNVFINKMVTSDPRWPTGGIKKSGYGRELGEHGIKEFVNIKAVIAE